MTIDADTLRKWLEDDEEVLVLDVRPQQQREEWFIPGSIHHDIYDKLKLNPGSAFDGISLSSNTPIVTVCAAGKTSEIAAAQLQKQGYEAYSLLEGMKGWTLSWNLAEIEDERLNILQIRRTGKGCLSYIIASEREAVVIDPSVSSQVYQDLAREKGWKIKWVMDTHIHADHLSRAKELADRSKALLYLPAQEKVKFFHSKIKDHDILNLGSSEIKVIHTPGHTLESSSFYVNDKYLFTGDTLFTDGVGRPDLKANEEEAEKRAFLLYDSLQKLFQLDNQTIILPGHTSKPVPFDHKIISSTLGEIRQKVAALNVSKEDFAVKILSRIPPTPPNYLKVTELNLSGQLDQIDPKEIEAGANRCAIS